MRTRAVASSRGAFSVDSQKILPPISVVVDVADAQLQTNDIITKVTYAAGSDYIQIDCARLPLCE